MKSLSVLTLLAAFAAPNLSAQTSPPAGSPRLPAAAPPAASPPAVPAVRDAANLPPKPAQLGLCVACHGVDGRSLQPGTPHIGGQDELYLRNSLIAYREGRRKAVAMNAISNALQPRDIEELAAWYAAQPGFGNTR